MSELLVGCGKSPREDLAYYRKDELQAYRLGKWKIHFRVQPEKGGDPGPWLETPLLYQIEEDPGEQYDVSAEHPEAVQELIARAKEFQKP